MSDTKLLSSRVFLSRKEASALTGLSPKTIAKLIASREVKSIRVGRRRLIPRAELDRFVARDHRISAPSTAALRFKSGKRKTRKAPKKRTARVNNDRRVNQKRKSPRKRGRGKPQKKRPAITDPRIARGLGAMRREGISASENKLPLPRIGQVISIGNSRMLVALVTLNRAASSTRSVYIVRVRAVPASDN